MKRRIKMCHKDLSVVSTSLIVLGLIFSFIACKSGENNETSKTNSEIQNRQWKTFNLAKRANLNSPFDLNYSVEDSFNESNRRKYVFKGKDSEDNLRIVARVNLYNNLVTSDYETLSGLVINDVIAKYPDYKATIDTLFIDKVESRLIKGETMLGNDKAFRWQMTLIEDSLLLDIVFVFKTSDKEVTVDSILNTIRLANVDLH